MTPQGPATPRHGTQPRITVLLRREGWGVNGKRIYRLYKAISLQLSNKSPKRRVKAKLREMLAHG